MEPWTIGSIVIGGILLIAGIVTLIVFITIGNNRPTMYKCDSHKCKLDPKGTMNLEKCKSSCPGSGPSPKLNGPVLYLLPEAGGFNIEDIKLTTGGYLLDPALAKKMFPGGIAVVANHSDKAGLDSQYNDSKVTRLAKKSGLPIRKWISFYFGKDGNWCRCQNGAWMSNKPPNQKGKIECKGAGIPCPQCEEQNKWVQWDIDKCNLCTYKSKSKPNPLCLTGKNNVVQHLLSICTGVPDLEGIMFDDESGDPTYIIQALEEVKTLWDKSTGKSLMLRMDRWTLKANSPRPLGSRQVVLGPCLGLGTRPRTNELLHFSASSL